MRRTRFCNEWMAPQDMIWSIGAKIAEAQHGSWLIGIRGGGRGLTPAEARVATALALDRSAAAIAGDQGCAVNTVRNHLARIFGKTGARRQSERVGLSHQAALPTRD